MNLNRRQMLLASGAAMLGAGLENRAFSAGKASPKKVLFFTKSSGFEHPVIERTGDKLGLAERILTEVGKEHGFEVVATKDGREFDPDKIGQWDAFAFETTGDLTTPGTDKNPPMSKDGKQAFLDAIHGGKGFIGMHCATDTFHGGGTTIDPYIAMIGGEFITHGTPQKTRLLVTDPAFPGASPFGPSFEIQDEWYALKNFPDDLHVIIAQDTGTMEKTKGQNKAYNRPNFPETWARMHGKGRVFYTSMGHYENVWESPMYQGLLMGALGWVTGQAEISLEPNVTKVTPGYLQIPG